MPRLAREQAAAAPRILGRPWGRLAELLLQDRVLRGEERECARRDRSARVEVVEAGGDVREVPLR